MESRRKALTHIAMRLETICVHAGGGPDPVTGAVSLPISLATTFERDADGEFRRGFVYARDNNPPRPALERSVDVIHPAAPDLTGIYGVIFWERIGPAEQRNVTVFADGEIDRSPCGSGTSARLAVLHARGELAIGQPFGHRSIVDLAFEACVVDEGPTVGRHATVITEVEGSAYRTGESMFSLDPRDPLGTGFLLR